MSQDFPGLRASDGAAVAPLGDARDEPVAAPPRGVEHGRHAEQVPARDLTGGRDRETTPDGPSSDGGDGLRVNLEFDFPSDVNYIERVVSVVIRQCEEFHFPPRQCALNVPVALTEALSNAILRGNGDDRRKKVRVRARVDQRSLVMEVADEGQGFDYAASMRDPTAPENIDREDGRGLYLMQRLMDRVERFTDRGNVVRLTLKRG
ncbi:MAG TPA: ATP-binding protein [Gemmatimonadaceae bacterium]|nr:ATP-binding protein [Gemmatimonadaceae bacterium]